MHKAHPAFYSMDTEGSSPRVRWLRLEVDSSPQLEPKSSISRAIPLLPL